MSEITKDSLSVADIPHCEETIVKIGESLGGTEKEQSRSGSINVFLSSVGGDNLLGNSQLWLQELLRSVKI